MTNRLLLGIGLMVTVFGAMAQQEPLLNQYMFNKVFYNPAAAGAPGAISGSIFGRAQWMGLQDEMDRNISPNTYGLAFDMPVYNINSGVGATVAYNTLGQEKNTEIRLLYAYQHMFANNTMLGVGLGVSIMNKSIDYALLYPWDNDPSLPAGTVESGTMTDMDLGVHYQKFNTYYIGFSATNLIGSSAEIGGVGFDLARHYYLYGGYGFTLKDTWRTTLVLTPGFMLRATNGSTQLDVNAILNYNGRIWGGLMFRAGRAVGAMAGVIYKNFTLGISYDYALNQEILSGNRSSVEAFVKYAYPIKPKPPKISGYNTRNL